MSDTYIVYTYIYLYKLIIIIHNIYLQYYMTNMRNLNMGKIYQYNIPTYINNFKNIV